MRTLTCILMGMLLILGCSSKGDSTKKLEKDSVAQDSGIDDACRCFVAFGELSWKEIAQMDFFERRRLYFALTDSVPDLGKIMDVDATSYAEEDTIPTLLADEMIFLHYKQKVKGYNVKVDFVQSYSDLNFGNAILHFSKPGHSFQIYCDEFSDEQLSPDGTRNLKGRKIINLEKLESGANVYLEYTCPKAGEYLSHSSPFYFKDMDFDGEEELVVNNLNMGERGYNTYDIFKVFHVEKPLRLKGLPFNQDLYKITDYNVEYEQKTQSVLDKRYSGFDAYGHYRYKSIPANGMNGLSRVFILEDAEDMGFYQPKNHIGADSVNLIQPYKKYKRINGKLALTERGIYEMGNYGRNYNEIVLERYTKE